MRSARVAVGAVAIIVVGIIGYAVVGYAFASTRVANTDKSLHTVISHRGNLNSTFKDINKLINGLSTASAKESRTPIDNFIANAKAAGTMADQDDASLVAARAHLHGQEWLIAFSRSDLDQQAARIDHARKALSTAKSIAADYVKDGEFFQAYVDARVDIDAFLTQSDSGDLAGAKASLPNLKTRVDKALQLSTAPGLPDEIHNLMVDIQVLVADFAKLIDARIAKDNAAIVRAARAVDIDGTKIGAHDLTKVDMYAFYKPRVDTFNSEMAKARPA